MAVHALTLGFLASGVALLVLGFPNPFLLLAGALLVCLAILIRPRLGKLPDEGVLDRDDAPRLFGLVDEIAAALATPAVDTIVIDHRFNASWSVTGLRRRVLTLGLPLFGVLAPQERVGLIAHELAHARNGDAARGRFVGSAVGALAELADLITPTGAEGGIVETLAAGIAWLASLPLRALLFAEAHLLLRNSQRAEFLADALAARIAGADAVVGLQERLLLASTFYGVVKGAMRDPGAAGLLAKAARALDDVPERERERRARVARLEGARLDSTHPPTAHRIDLLERRGSRDAAVTLDEAGSRTIDVELDPLLGSVESTLVDEYRALLYA